MLLKVMAARLETRAFLRIQRIKADWAFHALPFTLQLFAILLALMLMLTLHLFEEFKLPCVLIESARRFFVT